MSEGNGEERVAAVPAEHTLNPIQDQSRRVVLCEKPGSLLLSARAVAPPSGEAN